MTMFGRVKHVHLVGIGGSGMSGIAEVLLNLGFIVSGSDLKRSDTTERLSELGGSVSYGHDASHIEGADVVVVSSAVHGDNAEVVAARSRSKGESERAHRMSVRSTSREASLRRCPSSST